MRPARRRRLNTWVPLSRPLSLAGRQGRRLRRFCPSGISGMGRHTPSAVDGGAFDTTWWQRKSSPVLLLWSHAAVPAQCRAVRCVPPDCALRPIGQPTIVWGATKMMVTPLPAALIRPISLSDDGIGAVSPSGEPQSAVAICAASDVRLGLGLIGQVGSAHGI